MSTVPWIINNMILKAPEMTKTREPSAVELKVQKSLQQLTVPDWYTNKCVASPKIIVDRRPFESRPAPWKDPARNRKLESQNEVANGAVVRPVEENNNTPSTELEKFSEVLKGTNPKSPTYASKTFPKMSPSRKIQNINIVFPTVTQSPDRPVKIDNDRVAPETDCFDKSVDSLDFTPQRMSTLDDETTTLTASTPIKTSAVRSLSFQKTSKTPRMNCPPPDVPMRPPNTSFRESFNALNETHTTPKKLADIEKILVSPVAKFASPGVLTPKKLSITRIDRPAPSVPVTPAKTSSKDRNDFLERSSTEGTPFLTPKKSTEMENIIKNQQKRSSGKSFVEEIIQELNAKCSPRVKSNYVSPTSKNFVKKLVEALEMGCVPKRKEEDKMYGRCSDVDSKSGSSSATASIKDSDSGSGSGSDSEQKSSSSRPSTFRSFSRALENRGRISREDIIPYVDDEDESVYWIPLPTCKLPRTSSLKNMMSRLSSQGARPSSISSNPGSTTFGDIGSSSSWQPTNLKNSSGSGWGRTFDKRQSRSRQLFRIDETTVIDSGYSDRSGTNSSSSSVVDETWYEDPETTQTASEFGEDSENAFSIRGRPRGIPGHRQRTFVV